MRRQRCCGSSWSIRCSERERSAAQDMKTAGLSPAALIWMDCRVPPFNMDQKPAMAKKPGTNPKGEFASFNVTYEEGSQRSNRRVPAELLGGLDGDEPARGYITEQDREIAKNPAGRNWRSSR